jgi:maltokinase
LLEHITAARWFGGKGRSPQLVAVSPLPWLRAPGDWPAYRAEVAELRYADGTSERYQLLISYRPTAGDVDPLVIIDDPDHGQLYGVDGSADPGLHTALQQLLTTGDDKFDPDRPGRPTIVVRRRDIPATLGSTMSTRIFNGEQSNTSILYGDVGWLKIFRRLEPGANPDISVHDQLSRSGNDRIARLYGWLQADGLAGDDQPTDLAMLVEQIPDAVDGWEAALTAVADHRSFDNEAASLGAALAAIHNDLRQHFGTAAIDGGGVADLMVSRLHAASAAVVELKPLTPALTSIFDRLRDRPIAVQRVHADFHLGQALNSAAGWKIIDFEGEPAKPFSERSRPDSVWRDLAGALRSFDYAAAAAAERTDGRRTYSGNTAAAEQTSGWRSDCQQAFLSGYGAEATQHSELAAAYLADKAIYEIVYEARHRPDWLTIPLAAVTELAAGTQ